MLLPLQGVNPFVLLDPHLVLCGGVAVRRVLQILGNDSEQITNAADGHYEIGNVDTEWTIHAATAAGAALGVGDPRRLLDELAVDPALALDHLPNGVPDLGDRGEVRIAIP